MKALLLIAALLAPTAALAYKKEPKLGKCYDSLVFTYHIVAKHKGGFIELYSPTFGRALVKTKRQHFKIGPLNMPMQYKEQKEMELNNGFTDTYWVFEECK